MITEKLYLERDYNGGISRAADILKSGGIVAIPTETVYGLAASAYCEDAIKNVFLAKGRPQDNPLIVHISNTEMLNDIAKDIPETALICAKKFWPGPFTMVLSKTEKTAECVSAGLTTVAVRMPSEKAAVDIINASGLPLAAPSANVSGSPSPTSAYHVEHDLDGKIDAIVYGEECEVGVESTVVSFCTNPPRLLRPGAVTAEALREIIPDLVVDKAVLAEPEKGEKVESPGMKYKHYAPKTETYLVEGVGFADYVNNKDTCAAICFKNESEKITVPKIVYGDGLDEKSLAHDVFSALREIDKLGAKEVYIHAPSKTGVGLAVYNRLIRAAGFKVITLKTIIGLTGPTGAGKSSLKLTAEKCGFKVVDCDIIARKAVEKGTDGLKALVEAFGEEILNEDKTLNRKKLAEIAFSSALKTKILNKTIFPFIIRLVEAEIESSDKIIIDAPTLFESRINEICNKTIAVLADKKVRLARIMKRDGIDENAAIIRMNAGKPDEFYRENADYIIYNNGDLEELKLNFNKIIKEFLLCQKNQNRKH